MIIKNIAHFTYLRCEESDGLANGAGEPELIYAVDGGIKKVMFDNKIWEGQRKGIHMSVGFNNWIDLQLIENDRFSPNDKVGTLKITVDNLPQERYKFTGKGDAGFPEVFVLDWKVEKITLD